jgi:hypothetical protein
MPTVALLNGHTFAGGLMVAMMHDYRIMNPHRGYLCLNELELGMGLRPPMCSIFREKVGAATFRRMILEAVRFKVSFHGWRAEIRLLLVVTPGLLETCSLSPPSYHARQMTDDKIGSRRAGRRSGRLPGRPGRGAYIHRRTQARGEGSAGHLGQDCLQ